MSNTPSDAADLPETGCSKHHLIHCSQCRHDNMVRDLRAENDRLTTQLAALAAGQATAAPAGDWLWVKLMDFCKKRGFAPANFNDLFEIVDAARAARTPVDSVQDAARLKEAVGLLEELAEHDNYSTEYDGRMLSICPECGEQDGEHRAACAFVRAKAFLAARK